jgi:hypothetical protein
VYKLVQSAVDLGTLRQVIGAAQIGFDDLRPLPIGNFKGLFVFRKFKDMKVSEWFKLNQILANLGYTSVFVSELERLQYLAASLDQAQEFYQDFSQDFWQNPLLDCESDLDNIFAPVVPPKQSALPFGQEVMLRQKLRQALEHIASNKTNLSQSASKPPSELAAGDAALSSQSSESALSAAAATPSGPGSIPGYASVMRFLAGNDCVLTTDAFEQAALKLDQLESIELVPILDSLRSKHKVPTVSDYQRAAAELDLDAWLEVRQDAAIEILAEPESAGEGHIAPTRSQQLIDSVQHLMLVPVVETDLVPAYFHMGGVNDMPPAHVHLALLRHWNEVYGVKPKILGLGPDSLYIHVAKPISAGEQATKLAIEQFRYCPDSVLQSLGSVGRLALEISGCDLWQFWWE